MKQTILLLRAVIAVAGCSLIFGGPRSTPKKFMDAAKTADIEAMNKLFSKKAIDINGVENINSNNKSFSETIRRAQENRSYSMQDITENREGDTAFVSFLYRADDGKDSMGLGFYLSKEDGVWKIDNIGGRDREDVSKPMNPSPGETETPFSSSDQPPPPPSQLPKPPSAPISGGVLNGKATSLPMPAYPQIARAAKASGQVNVQVLIDENGNVQSANAVSGHPLLRAAAVAAAHQAKFSPTKLSGQAVKVTGILTYTFNAE